MKFGELAVPRFVEFDTDPRQHLVAAPSPPSETCRILDIQSKKRKTLAQRAVVLTSDGCWLLATGCRANF